MTKPSSQLVSADKSFYNPSTGINALDLVGEKVTGKDFTRAKAMLEMNYGIEFLKEKFQMLFELIAEENWTTFRLDETIKWYFIHKKFATWTIPPFDPSTSNL